MGVKKQYWTLEGDNMVERPGQRGEERREICYENKGRGLDTEVSMDGKDLTNGFKKGCVSLKGSP